MSKRDSTAYINSWWFRLLPDGLQVKIMAWNWRRKVAAPRR